MVEKLQYRKNLLSLLRHIFRFCLMDLAVSDDLT